MGALLLGACLLACSGDVELVEPGDAPLREALTSSPEAIAALPIERRMALAVRLDEALAEQRASAVLADAPEGLELTEAFDGARAGRGEDAVVALVIERDHADAHLHTLDSLAADGGAPPSLAQDDPVLEGLSPRAREAVARVAAITGATERVVVPRMPAAVVGDGSRVLLNPVWLERLGELDGHDDLGSSSAPLIEPSSHHRTDSDGWGCYSGGCSSGFCGTRCSTGYCGLDCGECACECGDGADPPIHCATADRPAPRGSGSPFDVVWLLLPAVYLVWRRRRR